MGQKSLLSKNPDFLFFSLFGHVFYGGKEVGFFFLFCVENRIRYESYD